MNNKPWTQAQLKDLVAICKKSFTVSEACERITSKYGRGVSLSNLRRTFNGAGLGVPQDYLAAAPVVRQERQEVESLLKREHKQLVEEVREYQARQTVLDRLNKPTRVESIKRRETKSGKREGCAVALASDWHIEEHVPKRADTAFNYYDLKVANTRANRFFEGLDSLIKMNRPTFGVRDLILWLGGDLMTGYLRNENREENELSPVEAVTWLKTKLSAGIDYLLKESDLETITIPCSHGNHGRTTEKRQISTGAKNSYEWLLYQWLAGHYAGEKRVKFVTDQSNHQYVDAYEFNLHFHHGDEVKYAGGIGGIAVPLMKAVAGWDNVKRCHYHHMGHWHQLRDFGNVTVNGSLIGYNAYAMSVRAAPEPPQQAFYIIDSKRGKTAQFPVWAGESE